MQIESIDSHHICVRLLESSLHETYFHALLSDIKDASVITKAVPATKCEHR